MSTRGNIKISVIVPVFNVERYLEKCIESIVNQTYVNLEIILVDDGSTDDSKIICDEYSKRDDRIKVIHKENGGLSSARNAGMDVATGNYIGFVDSDDYIELNMYETMINAINKNRIDLCVVGIRNVYQNYSYLAYKKTSLEFYCSGIEAYKYAMIGDVITVSVCPKLFRRECVESIRFPMGKYSEDAYFLSSVMPNIRSVWVSCKPMYNYYKRTSSITTQKYLSKQLDVIDAYQKNYKVVKNTCPQLIPEAQFRLDWSYFVVLDRMFSEKKRKELQEYQIVVSYLRKHWKDIIKSKYFRKTRKIGILLLKINVNLYWALVKLKQKIEKNNF